MSINISTSKRFCAACQNQFPIFEQNSLFGPVIVIPIKTATGTVNIHNTFECVKLARESVRMRTKIK